MLDSSTEEAIFQGATCISDRAMRGEYLHVACQGDAALRYRIESLLKAAEEVGSFMRTPAVYAIVSDLDPGGRGDMFTRRAHDRDLMHRAEYGAEVDAETPPLHEGNETPPATNQTDWQHRETVFDESNDGTIKPHVGSLIGQNLGHYRVESLIGSGGMGQVYLAEDLRLGRKVALKIISRHWMSEGRPRFIREAQLASALDHPNVCAIYDIGESSGWCFIAMQHIEGQTLEQLINDRPLASETQLPIALQVADALSAAHQRGIIHRDIKSRNIMVTSRGQVIVLDFGLAMLLAPQRLDRSHLPRVVGTPAFMSPEQARGEEVDCRSDLFSLGVVLFHMATGTTPFRGASRADVLRAVITEPHTSPREHNPKIPQQLAAVIDRALSKAPEDRYQSVDELASDIRSIQSQVSLLKHPASVSARRQRRTIAMVAAASILIALAWFAWQAANLSWARKQVPTIASLARAGRRLDAYDLAVRVRKYLTDDRKLDQMMTAISDSLSVTSEPSGARVFLKRFVPGSTSQSAPREFVGITPIPNLKVARDSYVVSVEKEGFDTFQRSWFNAVSGTPELPILPRPSIQIKAVLTAAGTTPEGMVFVPGEAYRLVPWNRPPEEQVKLSDYWIDRCEVTNREFKEFVDAGGYVNASYWTRPFVKDGRTLPWKEAMRELVDITSQPGPRNWSGGTYPEGKADHPVTDITWYEAAAYAAYRGKSLPTVFQWEMASRHGANSNFLGVTMPWGMHEGSIAGRANLGKRGTVPVGQMEFGMSPYGCYEMAGNVAEWCLNETSQGFIASGGSWVSIPSAWSLLGFYPDFHSSAKIGFRCVLNSAGSSADQGAMRVDLDDEVPEFHPAPEAEVKARFAYYEYDREQPFKEEVEVLETDEWRRERITYNGAGGERALAYLYVPKHSPGPHQVVHLLPAGNVRFGFHTVPQAIETEYAALVRSGRAVFVVVLKGYLERESEQELATWLRDDLPQSEIEFVDAYARHITDLRRGLDYLLSRDDVDPGRVAFFGTSYGGPLLVLPAIESYYGRYSAVILLGSGISQQDAQIHKRACPVDFVPLIRGPSLMVHGLYDEGSPLRTSAKPMYDLLSEPKNMQTFPGGHWPDPEGLVSPVIEFLDETFGPGKQE